MKPTIIFASLALATTLFCSCGDNNYEKHSETDEMPTTDSGMGLQTGEGTEFIAAPNAANTTRTPVPLDTVVIDTTKSENK